jgi:hypothetical protein
MISISSIVQNVTGAVIINETLTSVLKSNTARISRVATLDGGSVITHSGYSDGDRTLSVYARLNKAQSDLLWGIFKNETFVLVSISDGLFYSSIQRVRIDNGDLSMTILIKNREDI